MSSCFHVYNVSQSWWHSRMFMFMFMFTTVWQLVSLMTDDMEKESKAIWDANDWKKQKIISCLCHPPICDEPCPVQCECLCETLRMQNAATFASSAIPCLSIPRDANSKHSCRALALHVHSNLSDLLPRDRSICQPRMLSDQQHDVSAQRNLI